MVGKAFAFSGETTFETCPVCQMRNVKVEHGFEAEINGPINRDVPQKYWHCPVCGPSIVTVIYLPYTPEEAQDDKST